MHFLPVFGLRRVRGLASLPVLGLLASVAVAQTTLTTVRMAQGLARPVYVGTPPNDRDRLFVLEQFTGLVRIVKNGSPLATPFLDLGPRIVSSTEQGLLGMAFHPDFRTNGYVYFNYTRSPDGATMIERYTASAANPDVADPGSRLVILGPIARTRGFPNHNAGCLAFGPDDGYLYIALGDAREPSCTAQLGTTVLGKILRIDVDSGTPYAIPPSNPFVGVAGAREEIWTFGWRNPFRFSFDRETGDMYVGDAGWDTKEEISFQSGTSAGGENFGWDILEGTFCTGLCTARPCTHQSLQLPIHEYDRGGACQAVIGGYVYRGCAIPELRGTYFFADWCAGKIWSFRYVGGQVTEFADRSAELNPQGIFITSFGEDPCGELYFTTFGVGFVYKIVSTRTPPAVNLGFGKVGGNGQVPVFEVCGRLESGFSAELTLRKGPASSVAAFLASTTQGPVTLPFGTIVPVPILLVIPLPLDQWGELSFNVPGGIGPAVLYAQFAIVDPGATGGIGISNAQRITFP